MPARMSWISKVVRRLPAYRIGQTRNQGRSVLEDRLTVAEQRNFVVKGGQFGHRLVGGLHVRGESLVWSHHPSTFSIQGISREKDPTQRIEDRDVTRCVSRSVDYLEIEHAVIVAHRDSAFSRNVWDVSGARIPGWATGELQNIGEASLMVGMGMGDDDVTDGVPSQASRSEGSLDPSCTATDSCVDEDCLAIAVEDVCRDKVEVGPFPLKSGPGLGCRG